MKLIEAALIDVDGVLLDTEEFQYLGLKDVMEKYTSSTLSEAEYITKYCGTSADLIAKQIKKEYNINESTKELARLRNVFVMEGLKQGEIKEIPNAFETLEYFSIRGLPVALVTGSNQEECVYKLEESGLYEKIKEHKIPIISIDMVKRGKPFPESYILAAETLDVNPKNCVVFEDTLPGIQSAENAGMACFPIPNKWTKSKIPLHYKTYNNLKEALSEIKKNYSFQPKR